MESDALLHDAQPDDLSLTPRDIGFIVGFWLLYGVLQVANRAVDALSRSGGTLRPGTITNAAAESLTWALLTPPLFWLVGRYGGNERWSRAKQVMIFGAVGVVVVCLEAWFGNLVRSLVFTPDVGRPRGGNQRGFGPPPFWFGMLNALVIYLGVLAAGFARTYSLRLRAKREHTVQLQRQLAEARLDSLRRQLDPHFLFNTLNAIASLIERDPRGVRRMISRLAGLLRFSLEGADAPEIPLRRELELLQQYLEIMQVRFQGRLDVAIDAPSDVSDALVPTLILQPLVENAIKHGIEPQREGGSITVHASRDGDTLVLRVTDDGVGPSAAGASVATRSTGVGLTNTRARLAQQYGTRQSFTLQPGSTTGAVAEVRLPFHAEASGTRHA